MISTAPIGVFDSGVGGLSILHAIRDLLPHEDLIYVADSGYAPYGDRSPQWITERSLGLCGFLVDQGAKAVVVACNTATTVAVAALRSAHPGLPIVAIEPAVKPAVQLSRTGVVAVMATTRTLSSAQFAHLRAEFGRDTEVIACPCPGLADMVEAGLQAGDAVQTRLSQCLAGALARPVDVLVLGCTHYSFLREAIHAACGDSLTILDPAPAVARQVAHRLQQARLQTHSALPGLTSFFTSGVPDQVACVVSHLWQTDTVVSHLPRLRKHG